MALPYIIAIALVIIWLASNSPSAIPPI